MKITFDNTQNYTNRTEINEKQSISSSSTKYASFVKGFNDLTEETDAYAQHGRTSKDIMQGAKAIDVDAQVEYMTVMSHSMSEEDYGRMLKEGIDPTDMDVETTVTFMDKIKAELAREGKTITGFNDNLDSDVLKEIVGSEAYAQSIVSAMYKNDIPVTEASYKEASEAVNRAMELTLLTEGETKYLLLNNMKPTVDNIYLAKHSGAVDPDRQGKGYFLETNGYYAKKADSMDPKAVLAQVTEILSEAGIEMTETALDDASWMIEKGIPFTVDNYLNLENIKTLELPIDQKTAVSAVTAAMANNMEAAKANLTEEENKYIKAAKLENRIIQLINDPSVSIHDKRVLEETRLKMTAEVNIRLIESGFTLETSDLEQLVEALKKAEEDVAKKYFPNQETEKAVESKQIYDETVKRTDSLYSAPASAIGSLVLTQGSTNINITNLSDEGARHKAAYDRAGISYETIMTKPRADLGDSIKKAFSNVDDILKDLNLDTSDRNRRSVRILAYNSVPITEDNINSVAKADRTVTRVVEAMTPAATLKMIRDGVNPLKTSFEELETYLKGVNASPEKEIDTYAKYLYNLEQNKEITEDERASYIGIFRMLRQIEKTDGAVIGSVLEQNVELNFNNLLTAARTAKKAGMSILVDDSFGGLKDIVYPNTRIDVQISQNQSGNPQLYKQTMETLKEAVEKAGEEDVSKLLEKADLTPTLSHINEILNSKSNARKSWSKLKGYADERQVSDFTDSVLEAFTGRDEAEAVYEIKSEALQENMMDGLYNRDFTSVDIQNIKSSHIFLSVAIGLSREETYEIPLETENGLSSIRLTIRHGKEGKGSAMITVPTDNYGDVNVALTVDENQAFGYLIGGTNLLERSESLNKALNIAFEKDDITFRHLLFTRELKKNASLEEAEDVENTSTYRIYSAAKKVVEAIRETY